MDPSPCLEDMPKEVKENMLKWCDYSSVIALGKTCKTWHNFIRAPDHNLPILAINLKCGKNSYGMQVMSTVPFENIIDLNYVTLEYKQDAENNNVTRCPDVNWESPRTTLEFILLKSISKDFTIWSDNIGISKASLSLLYGESVDLQCSL
ncbi:Protein CBG14397 [Caenorhabditis briggsae]|uniref:Protein CBG14397 n=1 Tax=Caenorhabditis briggsae TaxID=6238 RepID=A8XJX0_CAEBR|nr:Protein CBG14397 [Caenorhabditis briggsae]CAP32946.2 Protein CBG14397 [Caenorhabditis briggsae]